MTRRYIRSNSIPLARKEQTVRSSPAIERFRRWGAGVLLLACFWLSGAVVPAADLASLEGEIRGRKRGERGQTDVFRSYAAAVLTTGELDRGQACLARYVVSELEGLSTRALPKSMHVVMSQAADAFLLLRFQATFARGYRPREDVCAWLFDSDAHLSLFLDGVSPEDDWPSCWRIIEALHDHDPQGRESFRGLILAVAVVWDQSRPPLHGQMGGGRLPFKPDPVAVYDYFKELYLSRDAKIPYRDLSLTALTAVVDVPVPLSELQWARKNVRGSAAQWKKKFFDIRYTDERVEQRAYQWPNGSYSLAAIEEKGGICVDQAYYATITARACGIPALIFVGEGRRGPHAWFGHLKDRATWELDAGRYTYDKYATGHALDPQTNRPMTDHDMEYLCNRVLQSGRYGSAARYARIASVMLDLGLFDQASLFAEQSLHFVRAYPLPWRIQEAVLRAQKRNEDLLSLLDAEANAFRRYPDFVAEVRTKQADLLRSMGRDEEAARLLARNEDRLGRDRDDLSRLLASEQIRQAYESGDHTAAREKLEDLMKDQKTEGQKVLALLEAYLKLTQESKQTREAARFLRRYTDSLVRRYGNDPRNAAVFLSFLLRAYQNDGDSRNAERVRRKIKRLR